MEKHASLSRREKRYEFIYLVLLLVLTVIVLSSVILHKYQSPFLNSTSLETQMLEQKRKFAKQQDLVSPLLEETYAKISVLDRETPQPFVENDIKSSINDIANSFENTAVYDTRKEGYLQIAEYYKMFYLDKVIITKLIEDIALFENQFEECAIGLEGIKQKQNAMLSGRS